jgi:hypothetical protein
MRWLTGDPLTQGPCCIYQPKNRGSELEHHAEPFRELVQAKTPVTL